MDRHSKPSPDVPKWSAHGYETDSEEPARNRNGSSRFEHVTAIRSRLREEGLSSSSVNCTLAALRGVARAAWSVGLMTAEEYARVKSWRCAGFPARSWPCA